MMMLVLTALVLGIVMLAMAIGVMVSGRRLRGSCGGVGSGDCACEAAGKPVCDAKRAVLTKS